MWVSTYNEYYIRLSYEPNGIYRTYNFDYFPFLSEKIDTIEEISFYCFSIKRKFLPLSKEEKEILSVMKLTDDFHIPYKKKFIFN